MSAQALQDYVFASRYARYDDHRKARENWDDAVDRVKQMHLRRYPQARDEIEWAFGLVRRKRVLGSQRALQFGGEPIEQRHGHLYNCAASYCDRIRFFQEAFWLLLCGCGVGFSVQKDHITRLPAFRAFRTNTGRPRPRWTHVIEDTPEGWADAVGMLLNSYFPASGFGPSTDSEIDFDYEQIAPAGTSLPFDLGTSPGPGKLREALDRSRQVLESCVARGQERLRPIDAYDIVMHLCGAALAGGSRRGATICVFSANDDEMLRAKTGNWLHENPQRSRSNNSCLLLRNCTSREQFDEIVRRVREFGEPGFIWTDSTEYLVNCCCEVGFWPVDERTGKSGWGLCTLTEINGAAVHSREDFAEAARAAALIGTWQAGYTDLAYLGPVTEHIVRRDALIGVSVTGMMEAPEILLDPALQREMAMLIKDVNAAEAGRIGILPAARTTCVKPAGTSSCLLATSSGIHPHHARRYFRRVRAGKQESAARAFAVAHPEAVEQSAWASGDVVLTFCIEAPPHALTKADFTAVEFLEVVRSTQQNWVLPGTRPERCHAQWLTNNVSNTVMVAEHEWAEVTAYLYDHRSDFTGVALVAASADKDYPQAPFCSVSSLEEIIARDGKAAVETASGLVAEASMIFDGNLWSACDAAIRGRPNGLNSRRADDWSQRAKDVATFHFGGDLRRLCHCLQDVHHNAVWTELTRTYGIIDSSEGG